MEDRWQWSIPPLLRFLFAYGLRYLASGFLCGAVLPTLSAAMITYLTVWGPDMSFLRHLSFILPVDAQGNARLDGDDIMRAFSLLALIALALSEAARAIYRLLKPGAGEASRKGAKSTLTRTLKAWFLIITMIFAITGFVLPFSDLAENASLIGMYGVVALFYVIAIVSAAIFVALDTSAGVILAQGKIEMTAGHM